MNNTLRITEIFYSLQGEARTVGIPTAFVRLTGCPLRCVYCDTTYAFKGGKRMAFDEILAVIKCYETSYVTVTGGEPLAQAGCFPFLTKLCEEGYHVSLETSGAIDVSLVDVRVVKVLDVKTPASGEMDKNNYKNLSLLTRQDQVKFVISDRADYEWSRKIALEYDLYTRADVLFSPVYGCMSPAILAEWILEDKLKVRFQIQLHKVLWQDAKGR